MEQSNPTDASAREPLQQPQQPVRDRSSGHGAVAWVFIALFSGYMIWQANFSNKDAAPSREAISVQVEITGKLLVAADKQLSAQWKLFLLKQAAALKQSDRTPERLAYVVLVGELIGPADALAEIEALEQQQTAEELPPADKRQSAATEVLKRILQARVEDRDVDLSSDEKTLLKDELGWFGALAPVTSGTTRQSERAALLAPLGPILLTLVAVVAWYITCGLAGFAGVVAIAALVYFRKLALRFQPRGDGAVYAETFALWLALYVALRRVTATIVTPDNAILLNMLAAMVSLVVLAWPWIRGIRWSTVRRDIGLYLPEHPLREIGFGLLSYCTALPFLVLGFAATLLLMFVQKHLAPDAPDPSHPVQEALMGAEFLTIAQVMILGVVVAPLCEEIMFRGVLFHNLRESTNRYGLIASFFISAAISSFIFSAIHPQGWVTIPVLMGLAFGFCIAREWRGSLMASMIAHGLTNFVTLSLNVVLFSNG